MSRAQTAIDSSYQFLQMYKFFRKISLVFAYFNNNHYLYVCFKYEAYETIITFCRCGTGA